MKAQIFAFLSKVHPDFTCHWFVHRAHQQIFLSHAKQDLFSRAEKFSKRIIGTPTSNKLFSFDVLSFIVSVISTIVKMKNIQSYVFRWWKRIFCFFFLIQFQQLKKNTKMYRLCKFYKLLNKQVLRETKPIKAKHIDMKTPKSLTEKTKMTNVFTSLKKKQMSTFLQISTHLKILSLNIFIRHIFTKNVLQFRWIARIFTCSFKISIFLCIEMSHFSYFRWFCSCTGGNLNDRVFFLSIEFENEKIFG